MLNYKYQRSFHIFTRSPNHRSPITDHRSPDNRSLDHRSPDHTSPITDHRFSPRSIALFKAANLLCTSCNSLSGTLSMTIPAPDW